MCTVSFIPIGQDKYVLTSNRDEHKIRPTLPPSGTVINNQLVYYPRDIQAGGTWIAAGEQGRIACLLNGALLLHKSKPKDQKSRGKLVLELFEYNSVLEFICKCAVSGMEQFTLIIIEMGDALVLHQFRWDGKRKEYLELDPHRPYLWSSEMYEYDVRLLREQWFHKYLKRLKKIKSEDIMRFHGSHPGHDPANDLIMQRSNGIQTVSISQFLISSNRFSMQYQDLQSRQISFLSKVIKLVDVVK